MIILYQAGELHVFLKYLDFSALRFREPHSKSVNLASLKAGEDNPNLRVGTSYILKASPNYKVAGAVARSRRTGLRRRLTDVAQDRPQGLRQAARPLQIPSRSQSVEGTAAAEK